VSLSRPSLAFGFVHSRSRESLMVTGVGNRASMCERRFSYSDWRQATWPLNGPLSLSLLILKYVRTADILFPFGTFCGHFPFWGDFHTVISYFTRLVHLSSL
jgi:hypothetical protein